MAYVTHCQALVFVFCLPFFCLLRDTCTFIYLWCIHTRSVYFPCIIVYMLQNRSKSYREYFLFTCMWKCTAWSRVREWGRGLYTKTDVETDLLANEHEKGQVDSGGSRMSPGGCANSPWGGGGCANIRFYDFAKSSQKLHDFERIWIVGGRGAHKQNISWPSLVRFIEACLLDRSRSTLNSLHV